MKKILLPIILLLLGCLFGCENWGTKKGNSRAAVPPTPIKDEIAKEKFRQFYKIMDTKLSNDMPVRRLLLVDTKFDEENPIAFQVNFADFQAFCDLHEAPYLSIYPVLNNGQLDLLFQLVDINQEPQVAYHAVDAHGRLYKVSAGEADLRKMRFQSETKKNGEEIAQLLLPNNFYKDGKLFYSTHLDKDSFLYWFKDRGIETITFMPALHIRKDNDRYISMAMQANLTGGTPYSSPEGWTYFDITYPCPPPRDCK